MMILVSTHRALAAKGATIYRVDYPAFTVNLDGIAPASMPASHEHFATLAQANKAITRFGSLATGVVSAVRASEFDAWSDR